jgi:hypothetical protein
MTESKTTEYTGREVLLSKNKENMLSNGSPPEAPKPESNRQELKSLIAKGAVGAVTLAGTTAIPLMVQKFFSPAPAPAPAVQVSPVQTSPTGSPVASPVEPLSPVTPPVVAPVASPMPSPTLLPAQMPTKPNQTGVVQIRLGTSESGLMQVEMDDEGGSKKPGVRRRAKKDDDDD